VSYEKKFKNTPAYRNFYFSVNAINKKGKYSFKISKSITEAFFQLKRFDKKAKTGWLNQ
jgi:hypothetical protein